MPGFSFSAVVEESILRLIIKNVSLFSVIIFRFCWYKPNREFPNHLVAWPFSLFRLDIFDFKERHDVVVVVVFLILYGE